MRRPLHFFDLVKIAQVYLLALVWKNVSLQIQIQTLYKIEGERSPRFEIENAVFHAVVQRDCGLLGFRECRMRDDLELYKGVPLGIVGWVAV